MISLIHVATGQYYNYPTDTNFYDIQSVFYQNYDPAADSIEGGPIRQFRRWERHWGPRLAPTGSFTVALREIDQFWQNYDIENRSSENVVSDWIELGPKKMAYGIVEGLTR